MMKTKMMMMTKKLNRERWSKERERESWSENRHSKLKHDEEWFLRIHRVDHHVTLTQLL